MTLTFWSLVQEVFRWDDFVLALPNPPWLEVVANKHGLSSTWLVLVSGGCSHRSRHKLTQASKGLDDQIVYLMICEGFVAPLALVRSR